MRTYINLFFLVALFFAACKNDAVPENVLPKDRMVKVLTDVHLVDGSLYNIVITPDSLYKYGMGKYLLVFKKNHTDTLQFRRSVQYYSSEPALFDEVYEQVVQNLQAKNDSLLKAGTKDKK
ncbi:DUF4296 domain-containing protein [Mucilaginibacter sp. RS28]|uniref:DUF4296 domain-containing protein n=1 Tax=Mucilaginibacter straminoryzae TaxID=2932774 RepID=A0A9X2BB61_9SPHI|nr:DUF4296 domain-containing protein [Mucilaginibacter straminoryzae]MCJ8209492.1 DUF4296 domain-containing protein [Mucilaginibacter straminoryzae]